MQSHYSLDKLKKAFYDRQCRAWTMLELDGQGNQIGDAAYHVSRRIALAWLAGKVNESKAASGGCTHGGH